MFHKICFNNIIINQNTPHIFKKYMLKNPMNTTRLITIKEKKEHEHLQKYRYHGNFFDFFKYNLRYNIYYYNLMYSFSKSNI